MNTQNPVPREHIPWNKGKLIGQKLPLKLKEICAIRVRLQLTDCIRDLVKLRLRDISHGSRILHRAMVMQQKTHQPVQFEITEQARDSIAKWVAHASLKSEDYLFSSRFKDSPHISTSQYARIVENWVKEIGLDPSEYGTHSMRRTKATLLYRRTKNIRAVQLLLGHI